MLRIVYVCEVEMEGISSDIACSRDTLTELDRYLQERRRSVLG
jgi:hypothetical protein